MALIQYSVLSLLILLAVSPPSSSQSIIQIMPEKHKLSSSDLYCQGWRFTVETDSAGIWAKVPSECVEFVKEYITGDLYSAELKAVSDNAASYANSVSFSGNVKNAWVFGVDEVLLSNVPYYAKHGFGSEAFDEPAYNAWVASSAAPTLDSSLKLYNVVEDLGFTIFLIAGRDEFQRNATIANLKSVGYSNWENLFLRGDDDQGTSGSVYKSKMRKKIEAEGYVIQGSVGDQWSDLTGYAVAKRSFKVPNPLYQVA